MASANGVAAALAGWPPPVLDPGGPYSQPVTHLAWTLLVGGTVIFLIVIAALAVALFGRPALKARLGGDKAIWIGGIAFPAIVLTALLVWGLTLTARLQAVAPEPGELRVRIGGEMWWWRVAYLGGDGREIVRDANELHIPAGRPVLLELTSADVIHSFWVPRLGGKMDMIPGRRNLLRIQADAPGIYGGQCAEYCGGPHALMGFVVVAHAPDDFARWLASRQLTPARALTPQAARGEAVFQASGCAACHAIAGSAANGLAGPDLTFVGARRSLGAGILPNNRGTLAGWVADSQSIKPGNRMPAYRQLGGEDLQAISAYLEQLR